MKEGLFTNVEDKQEVITKSGAYDKILENRSRPELPEEAVNIDERNVEPLAEKKAEKPQKEYKQYPNNEVRVSATEYFKGDELAGNVWINKYALKDSQGNLYEQTPDDMHWL